MAETKGIKVVCTNRKARFNFHIEEVYEAGIALKGPEVKSLRAGTANLSDSYVWIKGGEAIMENFHISPYPPALVKPDPLRPRRLLLHRKEISKLMGMTIQRGYTMVPLRVYFKKGMAKAEIGLARRKNLYDKREEIKKKAAERELRRGEPH